MIKEFGISYTEDYLNRMCIVTNIFHESGKSFWPEKWSFVEMDIVDKEY